MVNLIICRLCLTTNERMHVIVDTPLQEIFEKLTNVSLTAEDRKPQHVCYICYSQLRKCHAVGEQALRAETLLNQLLDSGVVITHQTVTISDRRTYNLTNGLSVSPTDLIITQCHGVTNETCHIMFSTDEIKAELIKVENDTNAEKYDEMKAELLIKVENDTNAEKYDYHSGSNHDDDNYNTESNRDGNDHHSDSWESEIKGTWVPLPSDSEDDLPLKDISLKQRGCSRTETVRKVTKKRTKRKGKKNRLGDIAAYAQPVTMSIEQQRLEFLARANSLNYRNLPLKCELCYRGFVNTRAYSNHRQKHDERNRPHECEICRMRYRTERQLAVHADTSHRRYFVCHKCGHRSHTPQQAREHEKWHGGHKYECKLCDDKFGKQTSYLSHMRSKHPTPHVCTLCGDSFAEQRGLLMHTSKAHCDEEAPHSSEPAADRYCAECELQFATREAWQRHVLDSNKHSVDENSPQCRICKERLASIATLTMHMREHERALKASRGTFVPKKVKDLITCDLCTQRFATRAGLLAHTRRVHLGLESNKHIVCEVCGKKFRSNAFLRYHQRVHTGERPYECVTCHKRFSDNNQLKVHTRIHTGERPFGCSVCGKRFRQKPTLITHNRIHTGDKPYRCEHCSKTFSQSNSLKLHVRTVHLKIRPDRRSRAKGAVAGDASEIVQQKVGIITLHNL